jgi:hypothetical protein
MFLLAFPDTFIIDNNMREIDNRIGVDHHRQTVETLCVMVSILGHGIADISEGDIDTDSHGDEHGGLPTMIDMTQEQLVGIGSETSKFAMGSGSPFC